MSDKTPPDEIVRFSNRQRFEHVAVMSLFVALAVSGFPQKFPDARFSQMVAGALGGIETARWLHRASGLLFALLAVSHLGAAAWNAARRRVPLSMVPTRRDFTDAIEMLQYYMGSRAERPKFGRFDYREKFEYWGLVFGAMIMTATGFVLLFPIAFSNLLAGALIPVAKIAHSQEGLMAFLVVITWHIYNAHLAPEVFPFNKTIFTGRISRHHMQRDHALEYERMFPAVAGGPAGQPGAGREEEPLGGGRR